MMMCGCFEMTKQLIIEISLFSAKDVIKEIERRHSGGGVVFSICGWNKKCNYFVRLNITPTFSLIIELGTKINHEPLLRSST